MVWESNQIVFFIELDASIFTEFEISEFEISRFDYTCQNMPLSGKWLMILKSKPHEMPGLWCRAQTKHIQSFDWPRKLNNLLFVFYVTSTAILAYHGYQPWPTPEYFKLRWTSRPNWENSLTLNFILSTASYQTC